MRGQAHPIFIILPRPHQPADELIHHRPVTDGQKLLADSLGNRVKTCAGAAGEDEAFHIVNEVDLTKIKRWLI